MRHELSGTVTNDGEIVSETIQKKDCNTESSFSKVVGEPAEAVCERREREAGFAEEAAFAEKLLQSYNKLRDTNYKVKRKDKEDSDYPDRVFVSDVDSPDEITVQIRHLDPDIIAGVGQKGKADVVRTVDQIVELIRDGITKKARVDRKLREKTILQLILPVPLGEATPEAIRNTAFDIQGFREVWISPFREDSFPLSSGD